MKRPQLKSISATPVYPFLLIVFYFTHEVKNYYPIFKFKEIAFLIIGYFIASILILLLSKILFKTWAKSSLFTFLLLFIDFFGGRLLELLRTTSFIKPLSQFSIFLPMLFILTILIARILFKSKNELSRLTTYLNLVFAISFLADLAILNFKDKITEERSQLSFREIRNYNKRPNIYLIIADGYAGKKELNDLFQFENDIFYQSLRSRDFYLAENSRSNYNYTIFSISSMLNLNYINGIEGKNSSKNDMRRCMNVFKNSELVKYLKSIGYTFFNNSVFQITDQNPSTRSSVLPINPKTVLNHTLTNHIISELGYHLITTLKTPYFVNKFNYTEKQNNQLFFNETKAIAENKESHPKLVLSHFMMPHYPYYFDSTGKENKIDFFDNSNISNKATYLSYLQYSNSVFLALIDHILANDKKDPIIFLMSDHGFREFSNKVDANYYFMNLLAIHAPEIPNNNWYKRITPINFFRTFLNKQFNEQLPLLSDSSVLIKE